MSGIRTDEERKLILKNIDEAYNNSDLTIKEACSEIGISDGTYYNWKNKLDYTSKDNNSIKQDICASSEVEKKVVSLKKDKPFMGLKKISKQLNYSYGIKISTRQVKKILNEHGLRKTDYPAPKKHPPRRFERLSRNEMWMMDIMNYTLKKEGRFYLISILDDYSRFIISHGVFKRKTIDNVIDVFHQAIEDKGTPTEFLTDRGSQFHSWKGESRFRKLMDNMGIKHILTSTQHPQTIGKLESFHRNIQRELLKQKHFETIKEVTTAIADYIDYYNHKRVHMGIDYLTPADRYYGLKQDTEKILDTSFEESNELYLAGRIEGQPVRVKENNQGQIDLFLAGKKIKSIDSKAKLKEVFSLN